MVLVTWLDDAENECFQECASMIEAQSFAHSFLRQQPIILDSVRVHEVSNSYFIKTELDIRSGEIAI